MNHPLPPQYASQGYSFEVEGDSFLYLRKGRRLVGVYSQSGSTMETITQDIEEDLHGHGETIPLAKS